MHLLLKKYAKSIICYHSCLSCAVFTEQRVTVWVGYFALQEQIAKYCENQSNESCSGKCQVKKIEDRTNERTLIQVSISDISEFLIDHSFALSPAVTHSLCYTVFNPPIFIEGYCQSVFRPPISA